MTFLKLLRAGFHGLLLFLLPWGVGGLASMVFDTNEVQESGGEFATYFAYLTIPLFFAQLVGISVKVGRERRALRVAGKAPFAALVEALDRHVRVMTARGISLAVTSLIAVGLALSAKWAQLGVLAVAGLGLNYLFATAATLVSAFSTTRPIGSSPFIPSGTATTAHSATSPCELSTSSIAPVESRWPATLITSSTRPITHT